MGRLRDMSIRHKLLAIIMLTSSVALLLACSAFAAYDWFSTRQSLVNRLTTMADVVGANSTAALVFDNATDARETLSALRAEPRIVGAAIFDRDGRPFALYQRGPATFTPPAVADVGVSFHDNHLEVSRPIWINAERLGTIFLRSDLVELEARMRRYGEIALVFLVAASLVTLLLGSRLRAVVTDPILRLLSAMEAVRDDPTYSVRAEKHGTDELGMLVDGFNAMLRQIAERDEALRSSLNEKDVLLKEVHHRVKNNLQIVASLLDLQARNIVDEATAEMLRESRNRVRSMGLIHEHLYGTDELARIDLPDYVDDLCSSLASSYGSQRVVIRPEVEDLAFDLDMAIPCGLIINELVSNAIKYAFPEGSGQVLVRVSSAPAGKEGYEMLVADDGVGIPEGVDPLDSPSLGLQLVTALTGQLRGKITFEGGNGTTVRIRFGLPRPPDDVL